MPKAKPSKAPEKLSKEDKKKIRDEYNPEVLAGERERKPADTVTAQASVAVYDDLRSFADQADLNLGKGRPLGTQTVKNRAEKAKADAVEMFRDLLEKEPTWTVDKILNHIHGWLSPQKYDYKQNKFSINTLRKWTKGEKEKFLTEKNAEK